MTSKKKQSEVATITKNPEEKCLYLDVEFNGTMGQFISIALINPFDIDDYFYMVDADWTDLAKTNKLKPWVAQNVIPFLNCHGDRLVLIKTKLVQYLDEHKGYIIYADWPEDFVHLLVLLMVVNPNTQVPSKMVNALKMKLITTPDHFVSTVPHNALEDARALYRNHRMVCKECKGFGAWTDDLGAPVICGKCEGTGKPK